MLFLPPRRLGLIFHSLAALLLLSGSAASLWFALQQQVGTYFLLLLLFSLVLLPPAVLILYRGYALLRASYILDRDGLRLRWGLRAEDIPLPEVEWVRPAADLGFHLPMPWLSLPGAILGTRTVEGLGEVEFMAAERRNLLLIATTQRVYAISPADPNVFSQAFRRAIEMGSLMPIAARSAVPAVFLQDVWSNRTARILNILGIAFSLILLVTVSLLIPYLQKVSLGFNSQGQRVEPGPPERLLLLPVLAGLTLGTDLILGLYFYRKTENRPIAYLLWASSILTPVLLLIAALILVFW